MMESVDTRRKAADAPIPALAQLAKDTSALVSKEIENFSPSLKEWHPYAGGVAAVTLHACYSREIKQYMSGVSALTADTVQVLEAADQLEKSLVQVVVEDGVYAEDGGKALIREMPPFEADRAVGNLAKKWVEEKLQMLKEMVTLNVSKEVFLFAVNLLVNLSFTCCDCSSDPYVMYTFLRASFFDSKTVRVAC